MKPTVYIETTIPSFSHEIREETIFHTHLANANKRAYIRRINERLKPFTPEMVTPYELTEE